LVERTQKVVFAQDCLRFYHRGGMARYEFRLYVTDETGRSRRAAENLRALCEDRLAGLYVIEVIDVLIRPDLAEEDRIIATPTAIRRVPPPPRRVIGDMSEFDLAATALDLPDPEEMPNERAEA
jgi:circadian clock protein KaiB